MTRGRQRKYTQQSVLSAIVRYKIAHDGNSPTLDEIADMIGSPSKNPVWLILAELYSAGLVTWQEQQPRTIEVVGGYLAWRE